MISIIIATYNSKFVLPGCIEAISRSSYHEIELVLVDNHSTDDTWQWIQNNMAEDLFQKIIKLRLNENNGYSYACNRGVEAATGDIILLLNPDTEVSTDAIKVCHDQLISSPTIGAIGCRLLMPNGKLDLACRRSLPTVWNSLTRFSYLSKLLPNSKLSSTYNLTFMDDTGSYPVGSITGAFMMMPRLLYLELGGLDEIFFMYGEDIDLCKRIQDAGYVIWYQGNTTTLHIKGGNGGKKSLHSIINFYISMEIYFNKYFKHQYGVLVWYSVIIAIRLIRTFHLLFWRIRAKL